MRSRKTIAVFAGAVAVALCAWNSPEASGLPGPPGPPPMAARPPAPRMGGGRPPVMGPSRPMRPSGISGPGGIGRPTRPAGAGRPGAVGAPAGRGGSPFDGGYGSGRQNAFGFGTTARPSGVGPGTTARPANPIGPAGPGRITRPGGAGGASGASGAAGAGGLRPGNVPGAGALGSLAKPAAPPGASPTAAVNPQALTHQANLVRNNYNMYGAFTGDWWGRHPGAWRAARWATAAAAYSYSYPTWGQSYGYCGYTDYPSYYDYGSNVVYERQYVYVNGDPVATQDQYAQQAKAIADTGKTGQAGPEEDWLPLGVFAMTQAGQVDGNDVFQLAVNKAGVIRGNYYNALSGAALPVSGSVDRKSQRAAWTVGDRKEPVFEAGFANLTKSETTMLVHWSNQRTQQWTLVRIEQPATTPSTRDETEGPDRRPSTPLPERSR